jgi:hypothetical protein
MIERAALEAIDGPLLLKVDRTESDRCDFDQKLARPW